MMIWFAGGFGRTDWLPLLSRLDNMPFPLAACPHRRANERTVVERCLTVDVGNELARACGMIGTITQEPDQGWLGTVFNELQRLPA